MSPSHTRLERPFGATSVHSECRTRRVTPRERQRRRRKLFAIKGYGWLTVDRLGALLVDLKPKFDNIATAPLTSFPPLLLSRKSESLDSCMLDVCSGTKSNRKPALYAGFSGYLSLDFDPKWDPGVLSSVEDWSDDDIIAWLENKHHHGKYMSYQSYIYKDIMNY